MIKQWATVVSKDEIEKLILDNVPVPKGHEIKSLSFVLPSSRDLDAGDTDFHASVVMERKEDK